VYGRAAEGATQFPIELVDDGDLIRLGRVVLRIIETPGHTPESISIVVYANGEDGVPEGVLTGDTLFIGDVGRPDLLSSAGRTADELAVQLYHSLHDKLMLLPDEAKVWPAHGAGSSCGKHLSTETVSTIGEQRRHNYALAPMTEAQFVDAVTQGQSVAPLYFSYAASQNRQQHELFHDEPLRALTLDEVLDLQRDGAVVVDAREHSVFAAGHLRGSVNVGLGGRFAEYAGEVMRPGTPIVLVAEPGTEDEARTRLGRIGFDRVVGVLADPWHAFVDHPDRVDRLSRLSVDALAARRREVPGLVIVDVRNPGELEQGTIPGAVAMSLPSLLDRTGELDPDAPTVVYCTGGYRSAIAASLLRAHGFGDVSDLIGGYTAWSTSGSGSSSS
jgi:rhodanese-related sulfurtransferase/glyoxylase-like metal-dependent hydrolase (beta-lactamase superfamily II)